eukprot:ANDGO_02486.mRNA.1 hypothetical protein
MLEEGSLKRLEPNSDWARFWNDQASLLEVHNRDGQSTVSVKEMKKTIEERWNIRKTLIGELTRAERFLDRFSRGSSSKKMYLHRKVLQNSEEILHHLDVARTGIASNAEFCSDLSDRCDLLLKRCKKSVDSQELTIQIREAKNQSTVPRFSGEGPKLVQRFKTGPAGDRIADSAAAVVSNAQSISKETLIQAYLSVLLKLH